MMVRRKKERLLRNLEVANSKISCDECGKALTDDPSGGKIFHGIVYTSIACCSKECLGDYENRLRLNSRGKVAIREVAYSKGI